MFRSILRPLTVLAALTALGAYATIMLRGPQGLAALSEKRTLVRSLEEENATLAKEIREKQDRIDKLEHDKSEQELEVRRRLRRQRPGDTSFVVQDQTPASNPVNGSQPLAP